MKQYLMLRESAYKLYSCGVNKEAVPHVEGECL